MQTDPVPVVTNNRRSGETPSRSYPSWAIYFSICAFYCAVSVGHELRHFCKTTAVTFIFRFSSAIVHFVKPNLSGGPLASAKPVVMSAFHADAIRC